MEGSPWAIAAKAAYETQQTVALTVAADVIENNLTIVAAMLFFIDFLL